MFKTFSSLLIIFLIILSQTTPIFSQSYTYNSYTTKDGLPSNIITALLQDKKGYIWIGTNNGLAKYDGSEFTIYSTSNGLSNNWITVITENPFSPESIWFGTIAGGANRLKNGIVKSYKYGSDPDWNNVSDLCVDKDGIVWVITKNGFLKIKNDSVKVVSDKGAPKYPENIAISKNGKILCSEGNQVYSFIPDNSLVHKINGKNVSLNSQDLISRPEWKNLNLQLPQASKIVSMISGSENRTWIGTSDNFIIELSDSGILRKEKTKAGIPSQVWDDGFGSFLIRDRDIFFSVMKNNLSEQKILPFPENEEMPLDVTSPFLIDREGNVWIGTWLKGLLKISNLALYNFQFPDNSKLSWSSIDQLGNIWVGAEGGVWEVYINKENQWQKKFHPLFDHEKNTRTYISHIDSENNLWLSLKRKIYSFKISREKDLSSRLEPSKLVNLLHYINNKGTLLAIYSDKQNRIWFSIAESGVGVADLKTGKLIKFYYVEDGIPGEAVRVIYQDHLDQIWLGGWQQGISIFSGNPMPVFKRKLTTENGLPDNMIRSVLEDTSGNMWIGTRHNGVAVFSGDKLRNKTNISMKEGLLSNSIWSIIEGPGNTMWLNTDAGIEQIDLQTLKVLPHKKEFLLNFDQSLSMKKYNYRFWSFCTDEELFILENKPEKNVNIFPPIDITNVLINGNKFSVDDLSDLSHSQNNISISFAGLSFKEEKAVTYQYKLIGADTNWTAPSSHRYVSFAALRPGKYTFLVRAINSEGIPGNMPASLYFIINPPFWQQWWFILVGVFIISILIFLGHRYRVNQLLKIEFIRTRISRDLHDEIGSSVGSIVLRSRMLQKEIKLDEKSKEELEKIKNTAAKVSETLRDIVWFVNPEFETLDDMILRMKDTAQSLLSGILYEFISPDEILLIKLSLDFRRNVFLSYKEILYNIAMHSNATKVKIETRTAGGVFFLEISDNGVGFESKDGIISNKISGGNGLKNLVKRMTVINGSVDIRSNLNQGTTILLSAKTT